MIIKFNKYRIGQEVYLWYGRYSCFLCRINDVYKVDGEWVYEVDCYNYAKGMIIENVSEDSLSLDCVDSPKIKPIDTRTWRMLEREFEETGSE